MNIIFKLNHIKLYKIEIYKKSKMTRSLKNVFNILGRESIISEIKKTENAEKFRLRY